MKHYFIDVTFVFFFFPIPSWAWFWDQGTRLYSCWSSSDRIKFDNHYN